MSSFTSSAAASSRPAYSSPSPPARPRGRSCVRRHTYDIDSREAAIHAPLDTTIEGARLAVKALLLTLREAQIATANTVRYGQGFITDVAIKAVTVLLDPRNGYDYWSGTNDLAVSQIAELAGFSDRQWQRVKKGVAELGIVKFVHRSIKSGLERAPGVDQDIQISDLYWFDPKNLAPWLRELFDEKLGQLKRERYARHQREGTAAPRTPIKQRDKAKCRIPARLNPVGWARSLAALAKVKSDPAASYSAREAEAVAYASRLAREALSSVPG